MSKTVSKSKADKVKRRLDSAIAGGVFLSRFDLEQRWGCTARTVITRVQTGKIPAFVFSDTSVRYKVADIEAYENSALADGFIKRAGQLKAAEEKKLAKAEAAK